MSVTYDTLTGDTQLIQYTANATNTSLYADSNTIAVTGPIWLPRIYGYNLTAFEIASSGKIAISLNDIHSVDIVRSNYINTNNFKNTFLSQSNYSLEMIANGTDLQILMDAYSNNININAASNININATSGNITINTSNNIIISASNNYNLAVQSNINLNAAKGGAYISAHNSNMSIYMNDTLNTITTYASNNIFISACNNLNINTNSNINIGSIGGDFKAYADNSNMYLTMQIATDTATLYTSSNMFISASNNMNMNAQSNINIGSLGGSFKTYADGSNMSLVLDRTTDNVTLYASSNILTVASNNYSLNAKSNINIGSLNGDFKAYANSSNMFVNMIASTNNVSLFSSNNMNISVSNNYNTYVNSNISASTIGGDYRLYINNSNMFMRMSATTNNINTYSLNSTIMSASNNFNIYALSNLTTSTSNGSISLSANSSNMFINMNSAVNDIVTFASNNITQISSNNFNINAQSNINIGANAGDFKAYADSSNMFLTMQIATDTVNLYTLSNMFTSASNNYNLNAKNNINIGALAGNLNLYGNSSNMFVTMNAQSNNLAIFASNNMNIVSSNSLNTYVQSNFNISTKAGDFNVYANSSNMFINMASALNNISVFSSNNINIVASNNYNINVQSNLNIYTKAGNYNIYANNSNMFVNMSSATNNISIFSSNNTNISVSNDYNTYVNCNVNINIANGAYSLAINNSNILVTMDTSNNTLLYTSNNYQISVSNSTNINVRSNINIGSLVGNVNIYANSSNMFLTMNRSLNTVTTFASNNMFIGASNNYSLNTNSNVNIGTTAGDFNVYANSSNMFVNMAAATNNVSLFSSNDTNISSSNNLNIYVQSNIALSANKGDFKAYANNSNVSFVMDRSSNNMTGYASNSIILSASNSYNLATVSNVSISANTGSLKLYSTSCNMSIVMDAATRNTNQYTSNNLNISVSNNYNLNVQSNINIGSIGGDFKAYADNSNMYLTMQIATDTATLYTSSNMFISASNNMNMNAQSNINIGSLGGSFKTYADGSNMSLVLDRTTDNVTLYASSNILTVASNNYSLNAKSNINIGSLTGDFKAYANSSNMSHTMVASTNTQSLYSVNQINLTSSNNFTLNAQSNITINSIINNISMYASNNMNLIASNNYNLNTNSNINIGALSGDINLYANSSNMFVNMATATNNISTFASNNINLSASNSLNTYVQSNLNISTKTGDFNVYANSSNMFVTLSALTNNMSIFASNNINITSSNSYNLATVSNVSISANTGSLKLYSTSCNMSIVMDAATRNTNQYTSNNLNISVSNNYNLNVQSNINIGAIGGDFKAYADNSNMYLTMQIATDTATLYTSSNMFISASNNMNMNAQSNINIGSLGGSFKTYADGSNMSLVLDRTTDNVTLYASSNILTVASNNYSLNAKSNINIGSLTGDFKAYANSSNMSHTMVTSTNTQSLYSVNQINLTASNSFALNAQSNIAINAIVNNISMYASNNMNLISSNNYTLNTRSNIIFNSFNGSLDVYANNSNMFLTMDQTTNNVSIFGTNNMNLIASNNFNLGVQSNIILNTIGGDTSIYANNIKLNANDSNMYLTMSNDVMSMYALNNLYASSSNNLFLDASSNISITTSNLSLLAHRDLYITASNNIFLTASNALTLSFGTLNTITSNDQSYRAQSNVSFFINSFSDHPENAIFTVSGGKVLIRGDIIVTGNIDTSNITSTNVIQQSLKVTDKIITLADVGSNFSPSDGPFDGLPNTGAGIKIDGVPTYYDSNIPEAYDKAIRWNVGPGNGISDLGTLAGMSNEPYWEMKGGSFKITHQKIISSGGSNIIHDVSFGLRVNELDELEIVKQFYYPQSNSYISRRIARFGRII